MFKPTPMYKFEPNYKVDPYDTLREYILYVDDNTKKQIEHIIDKGDPITEELAVTLESLTGTPSTFWLNLQKNYYND